MGDTLQGFISSRTSEIDDNVYRITIDNYRELQSFYKRLQRLIIAEKAAYAKSGRDLDVDNLFMVRSMLELPEGLEYRSATNRGAYTSMPNPFDSLLPISSKKDVININCPIHRDTVHFAINGLVSNLWFTQSFTSRENVVIEPLTNHMNEKLVNLNPVDTMIDVGNSDEPIKDGAIFIFSQESYDELSEDAKKKIAGGKVYIFDIKDLESERKRDQYGCPPLQIITDIVLCHNGILPQHTINQTILRSESFSDYDRDSDDYITSSDEDYLKLFTDLIDRINQDQFGISYYDLSEEIKARREIKKDTPGIGHYDTKYWDEEIINNNRLHKESFERYIEFLRNNSDIPEDILEDVKKRYMEYIDKTISVTENSGCMGYTYHPGLTIDQEKRIREIMTPEQLIKLTEEFNELEIQRIQSQLNQRQLGDMFEEKEETQEESYTK